MVVQQVHPQKRKFLFGFSKEVFFVDILNKSLNLIEKNIKTQQNSVKDQPKTNKIRTFQNNQKYIQEENY